MMQRAVGFAKRHDIQSYVAVTSAARERLLIRIGLPLCRFGDGKALQVGTVLCRRCWIHTNEEYRQAVNSDDQY